MCGILTIEGVANLGLLVGYCPTSMDGAVCRIASGAVIRGCNRRRYYFSEIAIEQAKNKGTGNALAETYYVPSMTVRNMKAPSIYLNCSSCSDSSDLIRGH
jgi:hypothetical protein